MAVKGRKKIEWTLQGFAVKIAVMLVTVSIGLWCGWNDSYGAFYIAVLIQAVNNLYDACSFFTGYTKFVTIFQLFAFAGALGSAIIAIIHFTAGGGMVDSIQFVIGTAAALSIPILHFVIEIYSLVREDRY